MEIQEFFVNAQLDRENLKAWIEAGWLVPDYEDNAWQFSGIDVARAQLIRDLKADMGVNDEGIPIILDLLDQLYGLRATLNSIASAIRAQDKAVRRQLLTAMRSAS